MKKDNTLILVLVAAFFLLFLGGFGMMGWGGYGMMGMMYYDSNFWIFNWIYMILITLSLILLVVWLIKQLSK